MDMDLIAAGVFLGNVMTLGVVWSVQQFNKHDFRAPWLAYGVFLVPVLFFLSVVVSTEGLPPQFDALAPQQSAAIGH